MPATQPFRVSRDPNANPDASEPEGYDPTKDLLVTPIGDALDGRLVVELRAWDGGPTKVAVTRYRDRKAGRKPTRLGRLTAEEASALGPLLVKAGAELAKREGAASPPPAASMEPPKRRAR